MQFGAPDDGRKDRLKHVERLKEINCETLRLSGFTLRIIFTLDLSEVNYIIIFAILAWPASSR